MKTKQWLILIALILPFAWSCKQKEIEELNKESQKLVVENNKKDSTLNQLFKAFNEIEENLDVIKSKQNIISRSTSGGSELSTDVRDRINEDIKVINDLMEKNKHQIAMLGKNLKESNLKIAEFEKIVERMGKQIEEKDGEIVSLKESLVRMNFKVDELNARIDTLQNVTAEKEQVIESKIAELNTAYYVFGTNKELIAKSILTKTGFLGTQKKLVNDLNRSYFTKVDITQLKEIPLNAKSAKLLTNHASDSYKLETVNKKVTRLLITNHTKFWEVSKYLVIEVAL